MSIEDVPGIREWRNEHMDALLRHRTMPADLAWAWAAIDTLLDLFDATCAERDVLASIVQDLAATDPAFGDPAAVEAVWQRASAWLASQEPQT